MPANDQNPNAFKLWINRDVLSRIGKEISAVFPEFDQTALLNLTPELAPLELKGRVRAVRERLYDLLPKTFTTSVEILLASAKNGKLRGFALWPYTDFVQTYGLEHRDESLNALANLTELFTAEFGVRPFLGKDTDETIDFLMTCAKSSNEHIRRWASEGSRPRLPWGERLDVFIQHPEKTLPILELLKNDNALYVRKSVANHLNDISKDHPQLVVKTLKRWAKDAKPDHAARIEWITHRALRSLIKNGNPTALSAVGVSPNPKIKIGRLALNKSNYKVGDFLELSFDIRSLADKKQIIVVDYLIHFMKSNRATSPKVFKLKRFELGKSETLQIKKRHHLKKITTRIYYPGTHAIEIQVNGAVMARAEWTLRR